MHPIVPLFSVSVGVILLSVLFNWLLKNKKNVEVDNTLHITTEDCPYDINTLKEYIDLFTEHYAAHKGIPIDVVRRALQNTHIVFQDSIYPEASDQKKKNTNYTGLTIGNEVRLQKAKKLYDTALFHELIHVILGGDRYHMDKAFSTLPLKLYNLAIRLALE